MFDIDASVYTARQNPTYDILTCGYTDESGTQTPILTKLQASINYNALWSYKIVFASNKQCNDVSYSGDGSAAIFVLDNVATANNKIVHIGRVKDLLT